MKSRNNNMRVFVKYTLCFILFTLLILLTNVCMAEPISSSVGNTGSDVVGGVVTSASKVWNSIALAIRIAAFTAIIFAGLRYMFTSSSQKAEMKKSMGMLALGASLVFGATIIVKIILDVVSNL